MEKSNNDSTPYIIGAAPPSTGSTDDGRDGGV